MTKKNGFVDHILILRTMVKESRSPRTDVEREVLTSAIFLVHRALEPDNPLQMWVSYMFEYFGEYIFTVDPDAFGHERSPEDVLLGFDLRKEENGEEKLLLNCLSLNHQALKLTFDFLIAVWREVESQALKVLLS